MRTKAIGMGLAAAVLLLAPACGGAPGSITGVGNGGNTIYADELDQVAELLAGWEGIPRVSDETVREVFDAILDDARSGDPAAARIVLSVAERQREKESAGE